MNESQIISDLIKGGEYSEKHRRFAIQSGIRSHFGDRTGQMKQANMIEGALKAAPYLLLAPPVLAAVVGDMSGRAHHRLELAASKRRSPSVANTRERLRAISDIAMSRGGFAIPGEEEAEPQSSQSSPDVASRSTTSKAPKPDSKGQNGSLVELLD